MKQIYPLAGERINRRAYLYFSIAADNYCQAEEYFNKLKDDGFDSTIHYERQYKCQVQKHCITTIIFSEMTIEAFFNDYAATVLGDDEFYDNFDKLSVTSKFMLITKFILDVRVNKGDPCYTRLKKLVGARNRYIHNKSKEYSGGKNADEMGVPLEGPEMDDGISNEEIEKTICENNKMDCRKMLQNGVQALKAIKEIVQFFDQYDSGVHAYDTTLIDGNEFVSYPHRQKRIAEILEFKGRSYEI